jgi:serine/threonine protein kinase
MERVALTSSFVAGDGADGWFVDKITQSATTDRVRNGLRRMRLRPGVKSAHYEILAPIGAGGMGEVYRARDARLERDVALKVLPERMADSAESLARFERETKVLAGLSHPHLIAIFDVGADQGIRFAVMEFLAGKSLRECLGRSALPFARVLEIGVAVAEGLAAAHAQGVIHRDLRPANIFLSSSGHVKILDFGLARFASSEPSGATLTCLTDAGQVMGTAGLHVTSNPSVFGI